MKSESRIFLKIRISVYKTLNIEAVFCKRFLIAKLYQLFSEVWHYFKWQLGFAFDIGWIPRLKNLQPQTFYQVYFHLYYIFNEF